LLIRIEDCAVLLFFFSRQKTKENGSRYVPKNQRRWDEMSSKSQAS